MSFSERVVASSNTIKFERLGVRTLFLVYPQPLFLLSWHQWAGGS
jgi:hypothetical protein